jgi:chorismate synthase
LLSSFGRKLKVAVFGGSHEPFIGVTIEGLPEGQKIDMDRLQQFLARRAPGNNAFSTSRREPDIAIVKSGLRDGITFGDPVTIIIENTDANPSDYNQFKNIPRPSHADYTARIKYGDTISMAGGGPFSGRMTAPLCIAGAVAIQQLEGYGIKIGAHILQVANIEDEPFDAVNISKETLAMLEKDSFPTLSKKSSLAMQEAILSARDKGDSLGGIVECCAVGVPAGIGGAMYDGVESVLAPIFFGIPAVKGVEFGIGFKASRLKGSENNDEFYIAKDAENHVNNETNSYDYSKTIKTKTNNHGGILGGITSGMPVVARLAFKPTPSIRLAQNSVNLETGENTKFVIEGRHDPCIVLRAVPVVEAAMAIGLLDLVLSN